MKPNQIISLTCVVLALVLLAREQEYIPEPKPEVVNAYVVEESGDRRDYPPEYPSIIMSPEVRGLFPKFRLIDKDDNADAALGALVERAKARGLPTLFLVDPSGEVHWEGDVPLTVEGWQQIRDEVTQ